MNLDKTILADPINRWIFSREKKGIFLVGGYLRDLLRGQVSQDRDFVLKGDVRHMAVQTSRKFNGTLIELKRNKTFRVALGGGRFIDFSNMKRSLGEDLSRRDFTVNALAWSPSQGIVDPHDGLSDIRRGLIRIVSKKNLKDDPLRVLRAFRIAAQLDFEIDNETTACLEKYYIRIGTTAAERITEELMKLIMTDNMFNYVRLSIVSKVLPQILGLGSRALLNNVSMVQAMDTFKNTLCKRRLKKKIRISLLTRLNSHFSQSLNRYGVLRLAILVLGGKITDQDRGGLRLSKSIIKEIGNIHNGYHAIQGRLTRLTLYKIFSESRDNEQEMALLIASQRHRNVDKIFQAAHEFREMKQIPLLDGHDIGRIVGEGKARLIGQIKGDLERMTFTGAIKTRAEARRWIRSNLT